jgi:hypothetical protein
VRERARLGRGDVRVDDVLLGVRAGPGPEDLGRVVHLVAGVEALDAGADGLDHARGVVPDHGGRFHAGPAPVLADLGVHRVHAGRVHVDEQLARGRLRVVDRLQLERVRSAELGEHERAHLRHRTHQPCHA